ncbi:MAG: Uma2 family endonuclease [Leptolyngbyaceae bacterium]|nr:Uma2 family endonuclease [Leptolyngbyaceae bacterium]
MVVTNTGSLTLEAFLALPETKPASEYINGQIIQRPMPKTRHSRLQSKLTEMINGVAEADQLAYAFPELRCTFGGRSIIPDIAIFLWQNIAFDADGEPLDDIVVPPDWVIEILSPDQSANRVTGNILHCIKHGCQMGWLLDPGDRSIMILQPQQPPELVSGDELVPVIATLPLQLTATQIFGWLKMTQ